MRKTDIVSEIVEKTGVEKIDVQTTLEAFFSVVKENMSEGKNIYIRGFGSFIIKKKASKMARNISKNTAIMLDACHVPAFKPCKVFVKKIKENVKVV